MKTFNRIFLLLLTIITLASCETEYEFNISTPKTAILNDEITITLTEENSNPVEEITLFINGKEISSTDGTAKISTKDLGVGKHSITALVTYGEKSSKKVNHTLEVFSNKPYENYGFKIINTYPHDSKAYTQGLEYHNGFLYESTGQRGKSTLRKVELKTGKVVQKINIDKKYFGEGMTIVDDKIYLLTWQARKGFVYDLETFKLEKEFSYKRSDQGWGLTHSDTELIKSDGTTRIWFLDKETQKEKRYIQAYSDKRKVDKLNELEYINGKIYANWWITDKPVKSVIVIINPENGVIEGVANLKGLRDIILKDQKLKDDHVLNGIAFDAENNRLFVTGKNWGKLFEIELLKK
ncbi:MAG: glutaminyl-peptide cyclotransferase [Flavobacteriaceae bacterium]